MDDILLSEVVGFLRFVEMVYISNFCLELGIAASFH